MVWCDNQEKLHWWKVVPVRCHAAIRTGLSARRNNHTASRTNPAIGDAHQKWPIHSLGRVGQASKCTNQLQSLHVRLINFASTVFRRVVLMENCTSTTITLRDTRLTMSLLTLYSRSATINSSHGKCYCSINFNFPDSLNFGDIFCVVFSYSTVWSLVYEATLRENWLIQSYASCRHKTF